MKLVVFSDVHADATTDGIDRFDDIRVACEEVVEAARRESADCVLFLGDLTDPDTSRSHRAVALMAFVAAACRSMGIGWRGIAGNHDVVEDGSGVTTISSIEAAGFHAASRPGTDVLLNDKQRAGLVLMPYPPRSNTYDPHAFAEAEGKRLLAEMARTRGGRRTCPVVVAAHLMIRGADPGSESADFARGRDVFFPVDVCRELFGRDALLLNGHYHRRQVATGGIEIPGSVARLRFDEEQHTPGFLICEHDGGSGPWRVRFELVGSPTRLWTIGPSSPIAWTSSTVADAAFARGGIVRLRPSADASDERIASSRLLFERAGALKVTVEPRALAAGTIAKRSEPEESPHRTAREVVMAMAEEARTDDRPALVDELDARLSARKI